MVLRVQCLKFRFTINKHRHVQLHKWLSINIAYKIESLNLIWDAPVLPFDSIFFFISLFQMLIFWVFVFTSATQSLTSPTEWNLMSWNFYFSFMCPWHNFQGLKEHRLRTTALTKYLLVLCDKFKRKRLNFDGDNCI